MSQSSGDNLILSVERLINKMEKLYERQVSENEKLEKMASSMESLSKVITRLESERNFEAEFNKRIDLLNDSLQRMMSDQISQVKKQDEEKTINKVINGTKLFGQVLSAVATGIQFSVENVGMALKKEDDSTADRKTGHSGGQADLSAILQPLNAIVKNLVEEKINQQGPALKAVSPGEKNRDAMVRDKE